MRVLIIGARGQLAQSLIERGQGRRGIELLAVGRPDVDLEQPGSAAKLITSVAPDLVVNAAAYTAVDQAEDQPELAFQVNSAAAAEIAEATNGNAPLIHISTDYVFDGVESGEYSEESVPRPLGVYGLSKLEGEKRVRAANPDHLIVRTSWVYSPFGRNFVKTMVSAAQANNKLTVVDDQFGCPTSALDLADGILHAIEARQTGSRLGFGETFHLAGTGAATWCEFAQEIMNLCRERGRPSATVMPITSSDWPTRAARPHNSVLSSAKFANYFGYSAPPWRQSLLSVVERVTLGA